MLAIKSQKLLAWFMFLVFDILIDDGRRKRYEMVRTSLPYMYTYLQKAPGNSIEDVYTESSHHQPQQL